MTLLSQKGELSKFLRKYLKEEGISSNFSRKLEFNEDILNSFNEYLYKKYNYESLNQSLFIPIKSNKIPEISINFPNTMNSIIITEEANTFDKNCLQSSIKSNHFNNLTPNSAGIVAKNAASCRSSMKNSQMPLGKSAKSQQKIDNLCTSTNNFNNNQSVNKTNVSVSRCFTTNKCEFYENYLEICFNF